MVHLPTRALKHNWSPLCSAIQSGNQEIMRMLVGAGADIRLVRKQHPAIAAAYLEMN